MVLRVARHRARMGRGVVSYPPVSGDSGYAAGKAGADALVADIRAALDGDSEVAYWDAHLAHDHSDYVLTSTGVSTLKTIKTSGGVDLTQATGSQQPSIDSSGPNSRGRIVCASASSQYLLGSGYTTAKGHRWYQLLVSKYTGSLVDGVTYNACGMGDTDPFLVACQKRGSVEKFAPNLNYDNGGAGAWNVVETLAIDNNWHVHAAGFTNPHHARLDGTTYGGVQTAGASARADVGAGRVTVGASPAAPASGFWEGDIAFHLVLRTVTTTFPDAIPGVLSALNTYYGGIY